MWVPATNLLKIYVPIIASTEASDYEASAQVVETVALTVSKHFGDRRLARRLIPKEF